MFIQQMSSQILSNQLSAARERTAHYICWLPLHQFLIRLNSFKCVGMERENSSPPRWMNKKLVCAMFSLKREDAAAAAGWFVRSCPRGETAILGTRMWASEKNANDFLFARRRWAGKIGACMRVWRLSIWELSLHNLSERHMQITLSNYYKREMRAGWNKTRSRPCHSILPVSLFLFLAFFMFVSTSFATSLTLPVSKEQLNK